MALTYAALNSLNIMTSDIKNAYLSAPLDVRIHATLGPEFGPELEGKTALIVRALYGLPSAGACFTRHLADCMRTLGYEPCKADMDLWMKKVKRSDSDEYYYVYVLLYVDDCKAKVKRYTSTLVNYFGL